MSYARSLKPAILHCHGAKGGLYGRIAARMLGIPSVYTAHGGSLHYQWNTPSGAAFLAAEKFLASISSGIHFVCDYERDLFDEKIGIGNKLHAVIYNGLWPEEFAPVMTDSDAADLLFIGDMRTLKGVDILLEAMVLCKQPLTACLVGDGPDLQRLKDQSKKLGLESRVSFPGRMAAAEAFKRGRLLVMPSRAESFPYVVLEAVAAQIPMIASKIGGIPEALDEAQLFPPDDPEALARAIQGKLADPAMLAKNAAAKAKQFAKQFSAQSMVARIDDFYRQIIG
jgi:glycosyltransferase involved in cell wall biosynthesis